MKIIQLLILAKAIFLSGCVVYLDHPDAQRISGKVIWRNTGKPAEDANITIWEGRTFFTLFPISYPAAGWATSDAEGNFTVVLENQWPADVTAHVPCGFGKRIVNESEVNQIIIELEESSSSECLTPIVD
ncbi:MULTISPECIES: hypothetical protein [Vibrio harveyi group]|uniref:hypothetical protein n=1 Tax=Vibrio harveyi group TaxID=717610 RepID=UPI00215F0853|nr:hypothetical protein [Vibrio alginolyticus]ELB2751639.1 hypothetical protein [Vibrio alginolyticus]MCS0149839.1 hypothetical protein [Vibrio alginolyticus]